ncbi:MAG: beta-glycosidase, partial [Parabacteroides sp.]|nr:beta-glycosidase [Parabacteroides sp.]
LFVRPGFKRVSLDIANASSLFMGSAYVAPDGKRLVAVYTNISDKRIAVNTALSGVSGKTVSSVKMYTTSQTSDLQEEVVAGASADKQLVIPARAVVTIVYDFNN